MTAFDSISMVLFDENDLHVKLLDPGATLPEKNHASDAAYDLKSIEDTLIEPNSSQVVSTGIALTTPVGTYGQIAPRSGLSLKGLFVNAGVIDRGYTGEIKVILFNFGKSIIDLPRGSRIAQLIIQKIASPDVVQVEDLPIVDSRLDSGLGSSGI